MKKDLIIIGAGNVGGFLAVNQELFFEDYHIIGFLDDDENKIGKKYWGIKVVGNIDDIYKFKDTSVAIGVANPTIKKNILNKIGDNYNFPCFISKNAWISSNVKIGKGVIIYPNVSVNHETKIDEFVVINMNCAIGHNSIIQKCSSLAPGVNFAGFTNVGAFAEIGIGVSTIQNIKIGKGSIIGGQAMLINDVPENVKVVGNPGRIVLNNNE